MLCVSGEYGFVASDQRHLKCLTCKYDTHNCVHVLHVQKKLDEDGESYPFLHNLYSDQPSRRAPSTPTVKAENRF